jgi:hypothetical protein
MRKIALLVLLLGIAVAAFAAEPEKPAASPLPLSVHPWWRLTKEQSDKYLEQGRAAFRKGESLQIVLKTPTFSFPLDRDLILTNVYIMAPPQRFIAAGYMGEAEPLEKEQYLSEAEYSRNCPGVGFLAHLATIDHKELFSKVNFELETDAGERMSLYGGVGLDIKEEPLSKDKNASSCFIASYTLLFPIKNAEKKLVLVPKTKWLRLWVITPGKRIPVTFWIDGSGKIKLGDAG